MFKGMNTKYLKFSKFFMAKIDEPGFALGKTLLGAHKVQKNNLHLT